MKICVIPLRLPGLNEYINACRTSPYKGAKMKAEAEEGIALYVKKLLPIEKPVSINFVWQEQNMRRDPDNIASAKKFILDTMVKTGRLPNDNWKYIKGLSDEFVVGPEYKVTLEIRENDRA